MTFDVLNLLSSLLPSSLKEIQSVIQFDQLVFVSMTGTESIGNRNHMAHIYLIDYGTGLDLQVYVFRYNSLSESK